MHIVIGIPTCNRTRGLDALLGRIPRLRPHSRLSKLSVLVVENGAASGAKKTVLQHAAVNPDIAMHYVHEPRAGIPFARNALLSEAFDLRADFLAFVDDDELPQEDWLYELLDAAFAFDADVIAGPVLSEFEGAVSGWIRKSEFFERRRLPTGTPIEDVSAGNVLMNVATLRRHGHRFVEDYPFTGGEDTIFFRLSAQAGARMIWCDSAIVKEKVGCERLRIGWMIRRSYRMGANRPQAAFIVKRATPILRFRWFCGGAGRICLGGAQAVVGGLVKGRSGFFQGVLMIFRGIGMILGAGGYFPNEYKQRHRDL